MHAQHRAILVSIRAAGTADVPRGSDSYTSSERPYYGVSVPQRRQIAKTWLAENKSLSAGEVLRVVDSLIDGVSHEEKTVGAILLGYHPGARGETTVSDVDRWLDRLNGWAEIDALCQNVFTAAELLRNWHDWQGLISCLARDSNINKRRAALVFLNGPAQYSSEPRLAELAFSTIDTLASERHVLVTKAVSWLLRSLIKRHRDAVARYLERHQDVLPKIAVREARTKLRTGTKSGRRQNGARTDR